MMLSELCKTHRFSRTQLAATAGAKWPVDDRHRFAATELHQRCDLESRNLAGLSAGNGANSGRLFAGVQAAVVARWTNDRCCGEVQYRPSRKAQFRNARCAHSGCASTADRNSGAAGRQLPVCGKIPLANRYGAGDRLRCGADTHSAGTDDRENPAYLARRPCRFAAVHRKPRRGWQAAKRYPQLASRRAAAIVKGY